MILRAKVRALLNTNVLKTKMRDNGKYTNFIRVKDFMRCKNYNFSIFKQNSPSDFTYILIREKNLFSHKIWAQTFIYLLM